MQAVIYKEYGGPEVLKLADIPQPIPKDNEVLINVLAAEVTKADCEMRSFHFPVKWFWLPLRLVLGIRRPRRPVLGGYFAGRIVGVGEKVKGLKTGDEIFGCCKLNMGAHAEYLCLPEDYTMVSKPANASFVEAAAVPLGGLNALHFMRRAEIQRGEKVLINGAGGSIGLYAVQIAKSMGAHVTAVDHSRKESLLKNLGVDEFIDYTQRDFCQENKRYHVIFNMVAKRSYGDCIKCLTDNGRYVMGNPSMFAMLRGWFAGKFTDKKVIFDFAGEKPEELIELKNLIEAERLKPVVDRVYPFAQAAEAHGRVETEQRLGAIILNQHGNS